MAANGSEKAFCELKLHDCRSVTIAQRQFRTKFWKQPPSDNSIRMWYVQFKKTRRACNNKSTGSLCVTEEQMEMVRQAFVRSPRKSTVRGSRELGIPQPTEEEEAKTETISPNAATKITTRRSPSKDDFSALNCKC